MSLWMKSPCYDGRGTNITRKRSHTPQLLPTSGLSLRLVSQKASIYTLDTIQAVFWHVVLISHSAKAHSPAQGSHLLPNKALIRPECSLSGEACVLLQGRDGPLASDKRLAHLYPISHILCFSHPRKQHGIEQGICPQQSLSVRDELSYCKSVWTGIWHTKLQTSFNSKARTLPPRKVVADLMGGYTEEKFVAGFQGLTAPQPINWKLHTDVLLLALHINVYFKSLSKYTTTQS